YSRLNKRSVLYKAKRKIEYCKAQTRAKAEHPQLGEQRINLNLSK
ncbi:transposase family protein, partial [Pseudomonas syringae pv. japonica str. M301072]